MRSLAGSVRGDGNFTLSGARYPFRVSSGQSADGNGTRVHLNIDPRRARASCRSRRRAELRDPRAAVRWRADACFAADSSPKAGRRGATPWRIIAKVKADPAGARLEQLEASYGAEDRALKFAGVADISFGASPLLHAVLVGAAARCRQVRRQETKRTTGPPSRCGCCRRCARWSRRSRSRRSRRRSNSVPSRSCWAAVRCRTSPPSLHADANSWTIDRLDFRAPGATQVVAERRHAQAGPPTVSRARSTSNSSDPDTLVAWLQGRSEVTFRSQKPLRLRGDVSIAADRFAIDAHEGRDRWRRRRGTHRVRRNRAAAARGSTRDLKADRLDLDAATALVRVACRPAGRMAGRSAAFARYRPRDVGRPGTAAAAWRNSATARKRSRSTSLKFGEASGVTLGRRRQFRPRQLDRQAGAEFHRRFAGRDHRI